jgi:hypothetical protein
MGKTHPPITTQNVIHDITSAKTDNKYAKFKSQLIMVDQGFGCRALPQPVGSPALKQRPTTVCRQGGHTPFVAPPFQTHISADLATLFLVTPHTIPYKA